MRKRPLTGFAALQHSAVMRIFMSINKLGTTTITTGTSPVRSLMRG